MKKKLLHLGLKLTLMLLFVSAVLSLSYPLGREGEFLLWFSRFDPWLMFAQLWQTKMLHSWFWLPLLVLLATAWWGRWFCRLLCPFGAFMSITDLVGRLIFRNRLQSVKILLFRQFQSWGSFLLAMAAILVVVESGWVLFFTPLALFSHEIVRAAQGDWPFILAAILIATLLFSRIWCSYFCPTGLLFAFVARWKAWGGNLFNNGLKRQPVYEPRRAVSRRQFITVSAALLLACGLFKATVQAAGKILRPPGALSEAEFGSVCNRCHRCIQVCPTQALSPLPITQGLVNFETPEFIPRTGRCDLCQACQEVCPTGALVLTPIAATKIGTARVDKGRCLAWHDEKLCFLCGEQCPVQAIDGDEFRRPTVKTGKCVGCGSCENGCPVEGEAAIRVFCD